MKSELERASRLIGRAAGTVNIALARSKVKRGEIAAAADSLEEGARVLRGLRL